MISILFCILLLVGGTYIRNPGNRISHFVNGISLETYLYHGGAIALVTHLFENRYLCTFIAFIIAVVGAWIINKIDGYLVKKAIELLNFNGMYKT